MHTSINLIDITSNKINEKVDLLSKLRKEIINYTNNFREFKLLKSDIIAKLLENEADFRQLSLIIKSITDQNEMLNKTIESMQLKLEQSETQLNNSIKENSDLKNKNKEAYSKIESLTNTNLDKELFIQELSSKINYLEKMINDYQKRIFISKYDRILAYRSPLRSEDKFKHFYEKFLQDELKLNYYTYAPYNFKNSYPNSAKNFDLNEKLYYSEKSKKESIVDLLKARHRTSIKLKDSNSYEPTNLDNIAYNLISGNNIEKINVNEKDEIKNNKKESQKKENLNLFNNENQRPINNRDIYNSDNEKEYTDFNHNLKNFSKNNFISEIEDTLKINNNSSNGAYPNKNSINNIIDPNNAYNINNHTNPTKHIFQSSKLNSEKEKATQVSELLLKIFSTSNITKILKRKFGDNFEMKLTEKQVDQNFIKLVENEVNQLIQKERDIHSQIKKRFEINKIRKSRTAAGNSAYRSVSTILDDENFLNPKQNKPFNNFTKNSFGYFDPKLQYGGESSVPNTTRNKFNERIIDSGNILKRKSKNRLSIDLDSKQYLFRENQGWHSVKEFYKNEIQK